MFFTVVSFFSLSFSTNANFDLMISRCLLCGKSTKFQKYQKYQIWVSVLKLLKETSCRLRIVWLIPIILLRNLMHICKQWMHYERNVVIFKRLLLSNSPSIIIFQVSVRINNVNKIQHYVIITPHKR